MIPISGRKLSHTSGRVPAQVMPAPVPHPMILPGTSVARTRPYHDPARDLRGPHAPI
jgi:hypothetical protein